MKFNKSNHNPANYIMIKGARENNLKNISLDIPKNQLVVITGLSGSGKSSLAFDTIYAEGQRRYLESLSSYARQFLGGNEKPDVDVIEGLSPSIAINQKTTSHNPRSTVGTVTEIYDYLRLIFARIGIPYCPNGHGKIKTLTINQIIDSIMQNPASTKIQILAPIARNERSSFVNKIEELIQNGFLRVRIDNKIYTLDEEIKIDKNKRHNFDLIVDRIIINHDNKTRSRIYDSIEKSLLQSNNTIIVVYDDYEQYFSLNHACDKCQFALPELEPRLFSFNSPIGACKACNGLGFIYEPDILKIIPDFDLSINEGAIDYFKNVMDSASLDWQRFSSLLKHYKIDLNKKIKDFTEHELNIITHGSDEKIYLKLVSSNQRVYESHDYVEGICNLIKRRHYETSSEAAREYYSKYMSNLVCEVCNGDKLSKEALSILINDKNIIELTKLSIDNLYNFFINIELSELEFEIAKLALNEITNRLSFLIDVGLDYLCLSRSSSTLSGGESQRIRLATQIGSALTGVLYVLDEPSIGLHQKDNDKLIHTLKKMRDLGNSLIVVEHDEDTMKESDYIIDIGPKAGEFGGEVVACGTYEEILKNENSLTADYLSKRKEISVPTKRRSLSKKYIEIVGASGNNLKNINVKIPLNNLVVVTGVSGSGKSTLINETIVKAITKKILNPFVVPLNFKEIKGIENIDKIISISQEPIGRTPRSNPATYVEVFNDIRDVFSLTLESKKRGYKKGRFSFNVKGGRCENCQGDGVIKIEMHFLPDVFIKCRECNGKKYNQETLQVLYKNKSIYDVLDMYVDEALVFFENNPNIRRKLQLMSDVGLGYLKLGTPATLLSGGEAQRIKISKYLQKKSTGKTLYVLDEPTTGLHFEDINCLIKVLNRIVDNNDSVIVIEHNLDLIKCADYIIDLGPDGGQYGGEVIAAGSPEEIIKYDDVSYTAKYLKKVLTK